MSIYRGIAKTDTEAAVKNKEELKKIANYMLLSKKASSETPQYERICINSVKRKSNSGSQTVISRGAATA